jgi:hypothetical protein
MNKLMNSKSGVADVEDPMFWGISVGLWLLVVLFTWKSFTQSETSLLGIKIAFSIASLPVIMGINYMMGQNG